MVEKDGRAAGLIVGRDLGMAGVVSFPQLFQFRDVLLEGVTPSGPMMP